MKPADEQLAEFLAQTHDRRRRAFPSTRTSTRRRMPSPTTSEPRSSPRSSRACAGKSRCGGCSPTDSTRSTKSAPAASSPVCSSGSTARFPARAFPRGSSSPTSLRLELVPSVVLGLIAANGAVYNRCRSRDAYGSGELSAQTTRCHDHGRRPKRSPSGLSSRLDGPGGTRDGRLARHRPGDRRRAGGLRRVGRRRRAHPGRTARNAPGDPRSRRHRRGLCGRRRQIGGRPAGRRRDRGEIPADSRPGQQCRHHPRRPGAPHGRLGLAGRDRYEPQGDVPVLPGRRCLHDARRVTAGSSTSAASRA